MDTDCCVRETLCQVPGSARVIEMDMRDGHDGEVVDADVGQGVVEVAECARGPAFDEHSVRSVEEVTGEAFCLIVHIGIDEIEIVTEVGDRDFGHGEDGSGLGRAAFVLTTAWAKCGRRQQPATWHTHRHGVSQSAGRLTVRHPERNAAWI